MSDLFQLIATGQKAQVIYNLREKPTLARQTNPEGITPLLFALYYGKEDIVQAYLSLEIPLNIFEAAALGDLESVKKCLSANSSDLESYSPDGWTPLHLASHFGRTELVRYLLEKGANIQAKSRSKFSYGNSPLHAAVASGKEETVKLLLEKGADPNFSQEEGGYTPLHIAASRTGGGKLVQMLLEKGADPLIKTEDGQTAKDIALAKGNLKEAEALE
ncbi:hypothetical protein CH373_08695 [Leptospira perolatii]|uniref:Uncharacterized protein n=1 Tax=Leptospira perolatii TaxID=2023191 RepID=A0A2M9ZNM0_9LEPT|nr:ankyrin repeat domain-containing protein [Leptospira perolatii]PJZ69582.1 hypothetical protein CH360_09840 [Leptospira perolatii]PJZ73569.1 hypothetical protein CH373_08695 [Leptospira perolatii]